VEQWLGDMTNISFQFSRAKDKHRVLLCMNSKAFLKLFCDDQTQKSSNAMQFLRFFCRKSDICIAGLEKNCLDKIFTHVQKCFSKNSAALNTTL
jgi:hypothetical protein